MGGDHRQRAARAVLSAAALLLVAAGPAEWRASPLHDPVSLYRIDRPRSPVSAPPEGVTAIDANGIARLGQRALLVDVSLAESARRNPDSGRWTLAGPARSIPGSLWFPEAGRVPGNAAIIAEFTAAVQAQASGRPVVVFCLADCWMSWNAALRLHRLGHTVFWSGAGRDGWAASGRPLAAVMPYANLPALQP